MRTKSQAHVALLLLHKRDGVPNIMVMDGAREQVHGDFRRKNREVGTHVKQTEPHLPWMNAAEGAIRELKKGRGRDMVREQSPKVLWDHCLERQGFVRSNIAHSSYGLAGQVTEMMFSRETADISSIAEFKWYEWVMFRDTSVSFPDSKMVLGRDLGPALDIGPAMTRKVIKRNGEIVFRSTVRSLTPDEIADPVRVKERDEFTETLNAALGEPLTEADLSSNLDYETPELDLYEDGTDGKVPFVPNIDGADTDTYDQYVWAYVELPTGDKMQTGRVISRKRGADGDVKGVANTNPILDSRTYEVQFPDGEVTKHSGNQFLLISPLVDHKKDGHAVEIADGFVQRGSNCHRRITTKGWQLCVEWKDGSTTWERLADLKGSYPIEVAEYAVARGLNKEPTFAWWGLSVLAKRNRIIAAINCWYHKRNHKFGIKVPRDWDEAVVFDKENGNTLWQDAVRKEMKNVRIAFKVLDDGEVVPPCFQEINCHFIFDVKMEDFRRKARLVAGGHMTDTPTTNTYASVVSRESVRIALTLAAFNDLEVKTADIENAYLTAPVTEQIWTKLGPEFGSDAGKLAIIVRSLYGLRSAGALFRNHLADCMQHLGWTSCIANRNVWYKAETRPDDGHKYYAYALLYVDDVLMAHHDALTALRDIDKFFKMKEGSIGDPD